MRKKFCQNRSLESSALKTRVRHFSVLVHRGDRVSVVRKGMK